VTSTQAAVRLALTRPPTPFKLTSRIPLNLPPFPFSLPPSARLRPAFCPPLNQLVLDTANESSLTLVSPSKAKAPAKKAFGAKLEEPSAARFSLETAVAASKFKVGLLGVSFFGPSLLGHRKNMRATRLPTHRVTATLITSESSRVANRNPIMVCRRSLFFSFLPINKRASSRPSVRRRQRRRRRRRRRCAGPRGGAALTRARTTTATILKTHRT